jgi:hypothetical protein
LELEKLVDLKAPTKNINKQIKDELKLIDDTLAAEIYSRRKKCF